MPIIFLFEERPLSVREYSSIFHAVIKAPHALLRWIFFLVVCQEMSLSFLVKFQEYKCNSQ